jgi:hypothetical protein
MKLRIQIVLSLLAALPPMAAAGAAPSHLAKTETQPAVSKFVMPANPSEGRDPFFPNSTRVYANNSNSTKHGAAPTGLALKSILGVPPRDFAIINNHTFAVGDEGDVITDSGDRLHIHCLEINPQAGTATVEANGTTEILRLPEGL